MYFYKKVVIFIYFFIIIVIMNIYIAQIFGIMAIACIVISLQFKKKTKMMFMQMIANVFYAIQYFVLHAYTAVATSLVTVLRCILFNKYDKSRKKIPKRLSLLLIVIVLIIGIFSFDGYLSLIPIITSISYIVGASIKNAKIYKIVFGICSFLWLYYNFKVGALVSTLGNIFEIISTIIALSRYKKKSKK